MLFGQAVALSQGGLHRLGGVACLAFQAAGAAILAHQPLQQHRQQDQWGHYAQDDEDGQARAAFIYRAAALQQQRLLDLADARGHLHHAGGTAIAHIIEQDLVSAPGRAGLARGQPGQLGQARRDQVMPLHRAPVLRRVVAGKHGQPLSLRLHLGSVFAELRVERRHAGTSVAAGTRLGAAQAPQGTVERAKDLV